MQWWCAATGRPWTWEWTWYPGVHLFVLLLVGIWCYRYRGTAWRARPWGWLAVAAVTLVFTLDWPLGALGAGYLASAHSAQFLLLTLIAAPAMLHSISSDQWDRIAPPGSSTEAGLRFAARALPGLLLYDGLVVLTHLPAVVDAAMRTQPGSMAIDVSWLVAGLALWWPIIAPPRFARLSIFPKMGYIFGATVIPTIPAMMMVFSTWPLYELYELAPRVSVSFSANEDIQLAGLIMKVIGDLPLWVAAGVVFYRGTNREAQLDAAVAASNR